jgi:hypothetical protein
MRRLKVNVLSAVALSIAICCSSCAGGGAAAVPETGLPASEEPVALRVACFIDYSRSTPKSGVMQPQPAEFGELLSLVERRGGELAVGIICEKSSLPLLRVELSQEPAPQARKPPECGNAFLRERAAAEYKAAKQQDEERMAEWRDENHKRMERFRGPLTQLLNRTVTANRTDVFGAVQRAAMFLAEPSTTWRKPPLRFALFVTDGIDDVGSQRVELPEGTTLILVGGSGGAGALSYLKPVVVESFGAGIRYLAHIVEEKGD